MEQRIVGCDRRARPVVLARCPAAQAAGDQRVGRPRNSAKGARNLQHNRMGTGRCFNRAFQLACQRLRTLIGIIDDQATIDDKRNAHRCAALVSALRLQSEVEYGDVERCGLA